MIRIEIPTALPNPDGSERLFTVEVQVNGDDILVIDHDNVYEGYIGDGFVAFEGEQPDLSLDDMIESYLSDLGLLG